MDEREREDIKGAWKRMQDGEINVESKKIRTEIGNLWYVLEEMELWCVLSFFYLFIFLNRA